jgi:hypothetical protein
MSHDPDSIPSVEGTDGASWNNKRLGGVVFTFQVSQHVVEPHTDVTSNIFCNDPSGPDFFDKSEIFRPESAVIILAFSLPGSAKWLARSSRIPATDDIMSICCGYLKASSCLVGFMPVVVARLTEPSDFERFAVIVVVGLDFVSPI